MDQWIHKWIWDDKSGSCNCKVEWTSSFHLWINGLSSVRCLFRKGQSIWSRDTPFLSISAIPDGVCVFWCVCVCMQFMHSRVNVFYWHMDAWILPYCYTWKINRAHSNRGRLLQMWHLAVSTLLQVFTSRMFIEVAFPQDFSGTKASQLRYSMKHGMLMNPGWQFVLLMALRLVGSIDSSCLNSENWVSYDRIENPTNRFQN